MGKYITKSEAQELIDRVYGKGVYKIIKMLSDGNKALKAEIECCKCSSVREYTYGHLRKGTTECMCNNPEGLRRLAKNYAIELYIEPDEGLITGSDLEEYIIASLGYDKPAMQRNEEFIALVEDFVLEEYERKKATKCKKCRRYYPKRKLERGICRCCKKGI